MLQSPMVFICGTKMKKERLDVLLVQRGFFSSREKAKRHVMTGNVLVNDVPVDKVGTKVDVQASIRIRGEIMPYVGRGGLKLAKALEVFPVAMTDALMIDVGASTGGFTDCALQHGVKKVYAVDVGYGQLAWKLRNDPRVVNWERTHIHQVTPDRLEALADVITIDVSFISLLKVLPTVQTLLAPQGHIIALIKPQFEAGKGQVGKGGIIRDHRQHRDILQHVLQGIRELGFAIEGLSTSPIRGAEGNIEFLAWLRFPQGNSTADMNMLIADVMAEVEKENL